MSRRLHLFSVKRLGSLFLLAAGVVGMFGAIDGVRDSKWYQAFVVDLQEQKLASYMFGSPAAFAMWYTHAPDISPAWGGRTFAGEFDLLHIKARTIGTYSELSNAVVGGEETNVYTIFRGFIEDFTAFGAVLISACIGGLASWKYLTSSRNVRSALFWLSAFYATLLFSPLFSFFSFNGVMLAWVVGWFIVYRAKPRRSILPHPASPAEEVWVP